MKIIVWNMSKFEVDGTKTRVQHETKYEPHKPESSSETQDNTPIQPAKRYDRICLKETSHLKLLGNGLSTTDSLWNYDGIMNHAPDNQQPRTQKQEKVADNYKWDPAKRPHRYYPVKLQTKTYSIRQPKQLQINPAREAGKQESMTVIMHPKILKTSTTNFKLYGIKSKPKASAENMAKRNKAQQSAAHAENETDDKEQLELNFEEQYKRTKESNWLKESDWLTPTPKQDTPSSEHKFFDAIGDCTDWKQKLSERPSAANAATGSNDTSSMTDERATKANKTKPASATRKRNAEQASRKVPLEHKIQTVRRIKELFEQLQDCNTIEDEQVHTMLQQHQQKLQALQQKVQEKPTAKPTETTQRTSATVPRWKQQQNRNKTKHPTRDSEQSSGIESKQQTPTPAANATQQQPLKKPTHTDATPNKHNAARNVPQQPTLSSAIAATQLELESQLLGEALQKWIPKQQQNKCTVKKILQTKPPAQQVPIKLAYSRKSTAQAVNANIFASKVRKLQNNNTKPQTAAAPGMAAGMAATVKAQRAAAPASPHALKPVSQYANTTTTKTAPIIAKVLAQSKVSAAAAPTAGGSAATRPPRIIKKLQHKELDETMIDDSYDTFYNKYYGSTQRYRRYYCVRRYPRKTRCPTKKQDNNNNNNNANNSNNKNNNNNDNNNNNNNELPPVEESAIEQQAQLQPVEMAVPLVAFQDQEPYEIKPVFYTVANAQASTSRQELLDAISASKIPASTAELTNAAAMEATTTPAPPPAKAKTTKPKRSKRLHKAATANKHIATTTATTTDNINDEPNMPAMSAAASTPEPAPEEDKKLVEPAVAVAAGTVTFDIPAKSATDVSASPTTTTPAPTLIPSKPVPLHRPVKPKIYISTELKGILKRDTQPIKLPTSRNLNLELTYHQPIKCTRFDVNSLGGLPDNDSATELPQANPNDMPTTTTAAAAAATHTPNKTRTRRKGQDVPPIISALKEKIRKLKGKLAAKKEKINNNNNNSSSSKPKGKSKTSRGKGSAVKGKTALAYVKRAKKAHLA